ncbi:MAG: hypothetical protein WAN59_03540 [Candidatus Baltobacteraceae bacterium]
MGRRAVVFASSKGGAGKSFCAHAFLTIARRAERKVAAFDLDGGTSSLAILHGDRDPEVGVAIEDVRDEYAKGAWIDAFHGGADDVLLDVPGGAFEYLVRWFAGGAPSLVAEAKAANRELVIASVIGIKRDSIATVQQMVERFGGSVRHVVVRNEFFGQRPEDWIIFDGEPAPTAEDPNARRFGKTSALVREVGGEIVALPRLPAATDAILEFHGLSFTDGASALEAIGRRHSSNVRYWLDSVEEAFANSWLRASDREEVKTRGRRVAAG